MQKRYYLIAVLIICLTVVESSVMMPLNFFSYSVSPAFILVCTLAFLLNLSEALTWAGLQGMSLDLVSPSPFGIYVVSCLVLVVSIKFMQDTWFKQSSLLSVTVISLVSLSVIYPLFIGSHYLVEKIGILTINPVDIITLTSIVVGILTQCVIVSLCVRIFARSKKFAVL